MRGFSPSAYQTDCTLELLVSSGVGLQLGLTAGFVRLRGIAHTLLHRLRMDNPSYLVYVKRGGRRTHQPCSRSSLLEDSRI